MPLSEERPPSEEEVLRLPRPPSEKEEERRPSRGEKTSGAKSIGIGKIFFVCLFSESLKGKI